MQKKLLWLSFVEGGAVMAAELCGARLLAPIFGSSLYVWSSVMGITLGALAGGYFFGGYYSIHPTKNNKRLFLILNLAAFFVMAMPLIAHYVVPRISYLPFLPGVVISSFSLLFLPVFLLGASSPFFIALQSEEPSMAGRVSGTIYAISTTGGILATFLCGFWLIPLLGLNVCLLSFGALLFVSCLLISKQFKATYLLLFMGLCYLFFQLFFMKGNFIYKSDGLMGHLEVKDVTDKQGETIRYLSMNGIVQTEMKSSGKRTGDYLSLFDTLVPLVKEPKNALLLGLGGGLSATILVAKNYRVDAVEIDERIIEVAKNYFFLDKRVTTFCEDARYFLNKNTKLYDLVFFDVFKAEEQPGHVLTLESLNLLKTKLSKNALVIINWHGYLEGETGRGTALLFNTLKQSGFEVKLCSLSEHEDFRNVMFVASLNLLPTMAYELNAVPAQLELVNTDNQQLMERLNANANKKWRANYLRYYQKN